MASTLLACSLVLSWLAGTCYGSVLFSSLEKTLIVGASPQEGQVLRVGEDKITVTWSYNQSFPPLTDLAYNKVKLILCYAPISQQDRAWRKTKDELEKDKTCQFDIVERPYNTRDELSFEWTIERDIPTASNKTTNLFEIQGISGRLLFCLFCVHSFASSTLRRRKPEELRKLQLGLGGKALRKEIKLGGKVLWKEIKLAGKAPGKV